MAGRMQHAATKETDMSSTAIRFGLQSRVCIVTGAGQGIGRACAERFAVEDASLALLDVDDARGEALADELRRQGRRASYIHCDVGDKVQVDAAVARVLSEFGRIDVLVNN